MDLDFGLGRHVMTGRRHLYCVCFCGMVGSYIGMFWKEKGSSASEFASLVAGAIFLFTDV